MQSTVLWTCVPSERLANACADKQNFVARCSGTTGRSYSLCGSMIFGVYCTFGDRIERVLEFMFVFRSFAPFRDENYRLFLIFVPVNGFWSLTYVRWRESWSVTLCARINDRGLKFMSIFAGRKREREKEIALKLIYVCVEIKDSEFWRSRLCADKGSRVLRLTSICG